MFPADPTIEYVIIYLNPTAYCVNVMTLPEVTLTSGKVLYYVMRDVPYILPAVGEAII